MKSTFLKSRTLNNKGREVGRTGRSVLERYLRDKVLHSESDKMNSLSHKLNLTKNATNTNNTKTFEPKITKAKYTLPGVDLKFEVELTHLEDLQNQDAFVWFEKFSQIAQTANWTEEQQTLILKKPHF